MCVSVKMAWIQMYQLFHYFQEKFVLVQDRFSAILQGSYKEFKAENAKDKDGVL